MQASSLIYLIFTGRCVGLESHDMCFALWLIPFFLETMQLFGRATDARNCERINCVMEAL